MSEWGGISFDHTVVGIVSFKVRPDELSTWREEYVPPARHRTPPTGNRISVHDQSM